MRVLLTLAMACAASAQTQAPLPNNYKTIFENDVVLVQRVHYAPHEHVPMHDHPAVTTVYLYLNDDKGFTIEHEGWQTPVHRPPAHAGAFRVSPGNLERHAIVNDSDTPADFLRIELKKVPVHTLTHEYRGAAPQPPFHTEGTDQVFDEHGLSIARVLCQDAAHCSYSRNAGPTLAIAVPLGSQHPGSVPVVWVDGHQDVPKGFLNGIQGPCEVFEIQVPLG